MTSKGSLLVRGSVNVDEFFVVPHIVNSGETLSSTSYSRRAGGKGANQAVAAAKAGAKVAFAGTVGNDGDWVKALLQDYGVHLDLLKQDTEQSTGRAIIQLSSSTSDNSIVLHPGANFSAFPSPPSSLPYSHLLIQNEVPLASTIEYLTAAHAAGLQSIFNPSPMLTREDIQSFHWKALTWLLVNEGEAKEILEAVGALREGIEEIELLRALGEKLGNKEIGVVVTKGAEGVIALYKGEVVSCPSGIVLGGVKDTTGAGDCFTGYFASFLSLFPPTSSDELKSVLQVAVQAAAMCVEREGAMESVQAVESVMARMGDQWPARFVLS